MSRRAKPSSRASTALSSARRLESLGRLLWRGAKALVSVCDRARARGRHLGVQTLLAVYLLAQGIVPPGFMLSGGSNGLSLELCHSHRGSVALLRVLEAYHAGGSELANTPAHVFDHDEDHRKIAPDGAAHELSRHGEIDSATHLHSAPAQHEHTVHGSSSPQQSLAVVDPHRLHLGAGKAATDAASFPNAGSDLVAADVFSHSDPSATAGHLHESGDRGDHLATVDHDHCLSAQASAVALSATPAHPAFAGSARRIPVPAALAVALQPPHLPGRPRAPPGVLAA
ncbi:MAG: hypothetical protein AAF756_18130 [Pseudomonadota bacterium]